MDIASFALGAFGGALLAASFLAGYFRRGAGSDDITREPVIHYFPQVGHDGEVSIDCIVRPTRSPLPKYPLVDQHGESRLDGIPSQRVGSLHAEVSQLGFALRWEPAQPLDVAFTSAPLGAPSAKSAADPAQRRSNHRDVNPLQNIQPDVHASALPGATHAD